MANVLIAGCGYVGTALAQRLADAGHVVHAIRRDAGSLPSIVNPIQADMAMPDGIPDLPEVDYVFYTAAAGGYDEACYRSAYVEGPTHLLAALSGQGCKPRRVFFTSSTGVYAQGDGEWVDEESPTEPNHFSGTMMLEGERCFHNSPFASTVVRLGGIYGPGRIRILDGVRSGTLRAPAMPTYVNLIHRDDCAGVLSHLMEMAEPESVYLGVDDEPAERGAMYAWVAQRLGVSPPAPESDNDALAGRSARSNKRCRNQKLRASGYAFRYPTYREGFESLISDTGTP